MKEATNGNTSPIFYHLLEFGVTDKCNMDPTCPVCIRGEKGESLMQKEVIDDFVNNNNCTFVEQLVFSGGEPSLNPEIANYCLNRFKNHGIKVNCVSIISNGLEYSSELAEVSEEWHDYCLKCFDEQESGPYLERGANNAFGKKFSGLWLSSDDWRPQQPNADVIERYRQACPNTFREPELQRWPAKTLYPSELAIMNGFECDDADSPDESYCYHVGSDGHKATGITRHHIDPDGEVIPGVGQSSEINRTLSLGNVSLRSIIDMLLDEK